MPLAYSILAGQEVDTSSEAWRHDCECRAVLALPTREARNEHLFGRRELQANGAIKQTVKGIAQHRGEAAAERIKADCMRIHNIRLAESGKDVGA